MPPAGEGGGEASGSDEGKFPDATQRLMNVAFLGKEPAMPAFVQWFRKAGAADYIDVANAATSPERYDAAVIEVMIA